MSCGGVQPLVTIVTPSLNQAEFIRGALESVLGQDYPRLECWVIDGGSTDGTLDILRSFEADPRYHWVSEPDRGQADAVNKGWSRAQGAILGWLNADDVYCPGAVHEAVDFLLGHPDVGVVYGECGLIDGAGGSIGMYPAQPFHLPALLSKAVNFVPQPAAFIRRAVVDSVGGLDVDLHLLMDFDFWLRSGLGHRLQYHPVHIANLRLHDEAKSVRALQGFGAELLQVYEAFFRRPSLPHAIEALRDEAMANAYYLAADSSFWAGAPAQARGYALEALRHATLVPRHAFVLLALSCLGRLGRTLGSRLYTNPYFPGHPLGSGRSTR